MVFKELSKEEFDTFTSNYIPSTPYQTSYYGDTMVSQGYTIYYLGLLDYDKVIAAKNFPFIKVASLKFLRRIISN